jgi:hypothetical protein
LWVSEVVGEGPRLEQASVAGGEAALKDARFPQFASQIGSPTPRFAALQASLFRVPDSRCPARFRTFVFDREGAAKETVMTMISAIPTGAVDPYSRLLSGLRTEFGCDDVGALADRILSAEAADFHWDSRVAEHYLGQYVGLNFSCDDLEEELCRVVILSFLAGRWHVGVCLVDGEGVPVDMLWQRTFDGRREAEMGFLEAR